MPNQNAFITPVVRSSLGGSVGVSQPVWIINIHLYAIKTCNVPTFLQLEHQIL